MKNSRCQTFRYYEGKNIEYLDLLEIKTGKK